MSKTQGNINLNEKRPSTEANTEMTEVLAIIKNAPTMLT